MRIFSALLCLLLSGLFSLTWAAPPPGAQMLGPQWRHQVIRATGTVIARNGRCSQLAVDRRGVPEAGGRVWVCYPKASQAPWMGQRVHVHGKVMDTRLTRMGPYWRVVPVVELRH